MDLCAICGEREADFEGVICSQCKDKQDELNLEEEMKTFEADMLSYNHKGEFCWIKGLPFCQEGFCSECQIYVTWLESKILRAFPMLASKEADNEPISPVEQ